ncbi:MAG: carbohydrate binding domain-containing protein [Bacteroidaceae bacterium]|nr:carbohydrate binding domain-containing protein [Bacteroidaceae bacterium]MDO4955587.1 alpha-L-arabinofuranosidase C-terminal domain-containing protein [Bacteroidales bacterium]
MKVNKGLLTALALTANLSASAQTNEFVIQTQKLGAPIQNTMYGIFFEDINYAADGGLYAELVKNRSFEFPQSLLGWKSFGNVEVRTDNPAYDKNPHYVRLSTASHPEKWTGLDNEGFFGMGVEKDKEYRFTVTARVPDGKPARIRVELVNTGDSREHHFLRDYNDRQYITIDSKDWKKYTLILKPNQTCEKAQLRIFLRETGTVDMDHVSLFPTDTWKGHENGLRKDLAQALADLKPGIFRFPGGCIVEGTELPDRYNWKNTVGPVENRPLNLNRWQYTFDYRFYPDYYQSYGLGFYEFFQLAEEIGSEPLPILSCGLVCQFQNKDQKAHQPAAELQEFIQDAMDLIEFANGDVNTQWGKLRADMGHPAPFNLKYLGIGNEQWGPEYPEHLKPFLDVIRKAHPEIKIVGSSGPDSEGEQFDYLWPQMRELKADLVDEHFYRPADWFLAQGNRYDNYDRKGPKVFAGEYACHIKGKKYNHFYPALLESAFMTNLERNADIVHMATYAPLFAHVEGWQWRPDAIWFDNLRSVKTCSYYVQQLYSLYKGSNVLSLTMNKKPVAGNADQNGLFASAVYDKDSNAYIVKVANTSNKPQDINMTFNMKKKETLSSGKVIKLQSKNPDAENTVDNPNVVVPQESSVEVNGQNFCTTLEPETFAVYILKK